jgi:hypothetical protein
MPHLLVSVCVIQIEFDWAKSVDFSFRVALQNSDFFQLSVFLVQSGKSFPFPAGRFHVILYIFPATKQFSSIARAVLHGG